MDPLPVEIPELIGLLVAVLLSSISNGLYGRGIGDISCKYRLDFSPSSPAFGIWALIYTFAVLTAVLQLYAYSTNVEFFANKTAINLYTAAWACATLWTPFFTAQTGFSLIVAAVLLTATASLALSASTIQNGWASVNSGDARKPWFMDTAFSLLAGWTTVASVLSVGIAWKANDAVPDVCQYYPRRGNLLTSPFDQSFEFALVFIAASVSAIAAWVPDPILPLPVAWAIFFTNPNYGSWTAFIICVSCSILTFALAYAA